MKHPFEKKQRLFTAQGSGLTMAKVPMAVPASEGGARFAATPGAPTLLSSMRQSIAEHEVKSERRKGARIVRRRKGTRRRVRRTSRTRRRGR